MNEFGSTHTDQKLVALSEYLGAYTTALKEKGFQLIYFDAFAGSGEIRPKRAKNSDLPLPQFEGIGDPELSIRGSARRALETEPPFDRYLFVDRSKKNISALENSLQSHPLISRCQFKKSDANESIKRFCEGVDWSRSRCVMFLDPYGSQVTWETLSAIANTKRIDLWYLFPAGLSVNRQISKSGKVHETHRDSLNRITGTTDWETAFTSVESQEGLFGTDEVTIKTCDPGMITEWMVNRLETIFGGGVAKDWMPLGRNQSHWYSLIFATGNPSKRASTLALKLAKAVMKA